MCFVELTMAASQQHSNFGVKKFVQLMAYLEGPILIRKFQ